MVAPLSRAAGRQVGQVGRRAIWQAGAANTSLALLSSDPVASGCKHIAAHTLQQLSIPHLPTCIDQPGAQHPPQAGGPADHVPLPHILVDESVCCAAQGGHMAPWDGLGLACTAIEVNSITQQQNVACAVCSLQI